MRPRRRARHKIVMWCLVCIIMQVQAAIKSVLCLWVKEVCQRMTTGTSGSCAATLEGLVREGVTWAYWDISDIAVWQVSIEVTQDNNRCRSIDSGKLVTQSQPHGILKGSMHAMITQQHVYIDHCYGVKGWCLHTCIQGMLCGTRVQKLVAWGDKCGDSSPLVLAQIGSMFGSLAR